MQSLIVVVCLALAATATWADERINLSDGLVSFEVPKGFHIFEVGPNEVVLWGPTNETLLQDDPERTAFWNELWSQESDGGEALPCPAPGVQSDNILCKPGYIISITAWDRRAYLPYIVTTWDDAVHGNSDVTILSLLSDNDDGHSELEFAPDADPPYATIGDTAPNSLTAGSLHRLYLVDEISVSVSIAAGINTANILSHYPHPRNVVGQLLQKIQGRRWDTAITAYRARVGDEVFFRTDLLDELRVVIND